MSDKINNQVKLKLNENDNIKKSKKKKYEAFLTKNIEYMLRKNDISKIPEKDFENTTWISHIDEYKELYKEIHKDIVLERPSIISDPCPNCKNTTFYTEQRQIRSLDEGQTLFYTCTKCGKEIIKN